MNKSVKWILIIVVAAVVIAGIVASIWLLGNKDNDNQDNESEYQYSDGVTGEDGEYSRLY